MFRRCVEKTRDWKRPCPADATEYCADKKWRCEFHSASRNVSEREAIEGEK